MRRVTMMLGALAMVVGLLAGPVAAAPGGNAANAHKCEEGGYLDYTDPQGNPFKNEGQCTSYAARGGQLVPTGPHLSLDLSAGTISGTGFTPNSPIALSGEFVPNRNFSFITFGLSTDATGAFTTGDLREDLTFCPTESTTSVEVTATDAEGVTVTQSFPLECGV